MYFISSQANFAKKNFFIFQDWTTNQKFSKSIDDETTTNGDDDFVTASECTYTQSRSSSFNTVSECEKYSPWWEFDKATDSINEDISKEKMVLAVGCPELPSAKSVLKTSITPPPGKIVHEVTETTHLKVQHCHTLGVSSFVLTSETVRDGKADGQVKKEEVKEVFENVEKLDKVEKKERVIPIHVDLEEDEFMKELRQVSKPFESKTAWSKYYNNYVNKITTKGYV